MGTTHNANRAPTVSGRPDRATVLRLAAELECDPRTAAKLLAHGPDAARNVALRERARRYFDATPGATAA